MVVLESVTCPSCGSPLDSEASVCPYCHSSSPNTAPWQARAAGDWQWTYAVAIIGGAAFILALLSDTLFGTQWITELFRLFKRGE